MTALIHAALNEPAPNAVRGEGIMLYDEQGRSYIDASGGPAAACLGHGNPEVIAAIKAQLDKVAYVFAGHFATEASEALAEHLAARAPGELNHVFFVSGGSEGVESALKFARQYHLERGEPGRHRIISRVGAYHGATLGALAVGGQFTRREPFAPMLMDVTHISPCYAYRGQRPDEDETAYGRRVADELETALQQLGPETVAAFIAEPVVGASLGALPAVPGYFKRIREICDRHGILLIFDEVFCGMGRTGTLFAHEQEGVVPDLCVVAKGLGAGYQPIGAVLVAERVHQAVAGGSGAYKTLHTYSGHPVACAAALAVQGVIEKQDLLGNVRRQGERLRKAMEEAFGSDPHVGQVRGRGLMQAIELVADRESRAPFPAAEQRFARARREAFQRGLICYPMNGCADGTAGDTVLVAPPYIVSDAEVDEIVSRLRESVTAALA